MKKWLVYRHTSPSGKIYIGITSNAPNIGGIMEQDTNTVYCLIEPLKNMDGII